MSKVTFDATNRLIIVDNGIVELDAGGDLYSEAKRQWKTDAVLNGMRLPFRTIGGDPLGGGLTAGAYYFLQNDNGWRIRPYEGDHHLTINGNLYPEDAGQDIVVETVGAYTVLVRLQTSSLTQAADADPAAVWDVVLNPSAADNTPSALIQRIQSLVDGGIEKGASFTNVPFSLVSSVDHVTPATGLSPTGFYLQDDDPSWTALSGSFVEIANGVYVLDQLSAAETDCAVLTLHFRATGADAVVITFFPK